MNIAEKINYDSHLAHHGIKGQQWGVKNGPPYPIGADYHSISEKKARQKQSIEKKRYTKYNKETGLTDKQKKAIKIGAVSVATFLTVYGTYKLADSGELHRLIQKGKVVRGIAEDGFKKNPDLANKMTADEIAHTFFGKINPGFQTELGTTNNCKRCTFAYELSRRGYDVKATKTLNGTGQNLISHDKVVGNERNLTYKGIKKGLKNIIDTAIREGEISEEKSKKMVGEFFKSTDINIKYRMENDKLIKPSESIFNALSKMPNGARGELACKWASGGSHSMAWEIINNNPVIFDMQTSKMYKNKEALNDLAFFMKGASFTRLDDKELNLDLLHRWVAND